MSKGVTPLDPLARCALRTKIQNVYIIFLMDFQLFFEKMLSLNNICLRFLH